MQSRADSFFSSHREHVIEHLFVGGLLRHLWIRGVHQVDVLRSEVDAAGYDVVMDCESVVRHIQLKATRLDGKRANVNVNVQLGDKPSGCVVWIHFDPDTLELGPFLWFGAAPGQPLPSLADLRIGRHTKGDATGQKAERPNIRIIPKGRFERIESIADLALRLFTFSDDS